MKIKRNADDVGTSDTCETNDKQRWYPHHRHFVLLWFPRNFNAKHLYNPTS